jgi:hypothetical protein
VSEVLIGSGGESLTLTHCDSDHDTVLAELRVGAFSASQRVYHGWPSGFADLAAFFESLSRDWLGWDGERRWDSVEDDLGIGASWKSGHVHLRITLREEDPARNDRWRWEATAWVTLEPGEQLTHVATDVRKLFDRS